MLLLPRNPIFALGNSLFFLALSYLVRRRKLCKVVDISAAAVTVRPQSADCYHCRGQEDTREGRVDSTTLTLGTDQQVTRCWRFNNISSENRSQPLKRLPRVVVSWWNTSLNILADIFKGVQVWEQMILMMMKKMMIWWYWSYQSTLLIMDCSECWLLSLN